MAGAARRAEIAHSAGVVQAYTTAALMRAKRLPPIDKLLARRVPRQRAQSRVELQAMCDALAAAWGAKLE